VVVAATRILPSGRRASSTPTSAPLSPTAILPSPPPKLVSIVPLALNRTSVTSPSRPKPAVLPTARILPLGWMRMSLSTSNCPVNTSRWTLPPLPKDASGVPLTL
jgi:hypothetical protein